LKGFLYTTVALKRHTFFQRSACFTLADTGCFI